MLGWSPMDLAEYRDSESERKRIADLVRLLPGNLDSVLDIGARDGFISKLLTGHFPNVTALDLVFCAEVIEHIPSRTLARACGELSRVAREYLLIGVPYKQDLRVGRLTCHACGKKNPPWGRVNSFDENSL